MTQICDLLGHCRELAGAAGLTDRCGFVRASADALTPVPDESVDVVESGTGQERRAVAYLGAKTPAPASA
jgi:hypothetical protein